MMQKTIVKRDGAQVPFDPQKISNAVMKAFEETNEAKSPSLARRQSDIVARMVVAALEEGCEETPTVEQVQDLVEESLMSLRFSKTAKAYILYREKHQRERSRKEKNMDILYGKFMDVTTQGKDSVVTKGASGNANVDTEGPMGKMLSYGAETSKLLALEELVSEEFASAHKNGDIHIHDLDFFPTKTLTCCQIDLEKLFTNGFSTGHGFLRDPQSIGSYTALAAIALQANQNDQHGGQSIPAFDFYMAPGVLKTYKKRFRDLLIYGLKDLDGVTDPESKDVQEFVSKVVEKIDSIEFNPIDEDIGKDVYEFKGCVDEYYCDVMIAKVADRAYKETDRATYQAMEGFIHNMNTMHSRAGAQVPFTSINYGTDTSPEGRMVMKNLLLATESGLGNGETPIFP